MASVMVIDLIKTTPYFRKYTETRILQCSRILVLFTLPQSPFGLTHWALLGTAPKGERMVVKGDMLPLCLSISGTGLGALLYASTS